MTRLVSTTVLIASVSAAVAACSRSAAEQPPPSRLVAVRAAPVSLELAAPPVTATGALGPKEEITLSFKIGGVIGAVLAEEGQTARQGDTLAALDLREIDAGVARAQSAAEKAERDLARARRLYADSVATLEQVQNAETGYDVAGAELTAARFNRRYAVIVAPAPGVILRRSAEPGELVQPGTSIFTLGSHARGVVFRAGLADRAVVRVRHGDPATVRFPALPGRTFEGLVTEIAAAPDLATGTYRVEIGLPDAVALVSGLVGDVEIRPATRQRVATIPIEALVEADGGQATVYAVDPTGPRVERRRVTLAFLSGDRVAVAGGLDGVHQVVTAGAAYLRDGDAVRVLP